MVLRDASASKKGVGRGDHFYSLSNLNPSFPGSPWSMDDGGVGHCHFRSYGTNNRPNNKYHPKKLRSWPAWSLAARRSLVRDCELAAASNVPKSRQRQPATPAPAENWEDFSPASATISRGHQYLPGRLWGAVFNLYTLGGLWNSSMDFSFLSAQGWLM